MSRIPLSLLKYIILNLYRLDIKIVLMLKYYKDLSKYIALILRFFKYIYKYPAILVTV